VTTTGPGERSPGPPKFPRKPDPKNGEPEMNSDPNRCPVCQCEMFTRVADEWCSSGHAFLVTFRCVDHGHAWTETLTLTVRTVHDENGDHDIVVRETTN
jgi:hypothetical protein